MAKKEVVSFQEKQGLNVVASWPSWVGKPHWAKYRTIDAVGMLWWHEGIPVLNNGTWVSSLKMDNKNSVEQAYLVTSKDLLNSCEEYSVEKAWYRN